MPQRMKLVGRDVALEKKVKELALDTLLGNLPVAFYWMDRNGYQVGCNDRELDLLDLTSYDQFIGKHSSEISHFSAWENSKQVMESNQVMTMEEKGRPDKDGQCPYFLSIKSPIQDEKGEVIGMLGVSIDITERKRYEELLKQAKEKAESANRAKTEFLSMVSHELRIPLSGVIGMSRLLDLEYLLPAQHEQVQDIIEAGEHLLSLVDDLLDMAKLEAGKLELNPAPFDFKRMLEDTIVILNFQAKSKGIDLLLNYEENNPNIIVADERALRQILINLIGNALKFTHHGHVMIRVKCQHKDQKSAVIAISVEDTGIGIAQDKLQLIFERFEQAGDPTYKRRYGGTGLGLAISKAYTELMGGKVEVQSELGKGSIFTSTIPVLLPSAAMIASPWEPYKKNVYILIATDASICVENLKKALGDSHTEIVSGNEALKTLEFALEKKQPYQIVMIDQQLATEDAMQLGPKINRQFAENKPMQLLLTSQDTSISKESLKFAGFFANLTKSAKAEELLLGLTAAWEEWSEKVSLNTAMALKEDGARAHVLLVEDDRIVQKVHRMMLEKLGYQVDVAENGPMALEKTTQTNYDAIFMDVGLPGMSGLEVTTEIRQREKNLKHTPVIAMTAYVYEEDKRNCLAAGMDEVAIKPISLGDLQKIMQRWVSKQNS